MVVYCNKLIEDVHETVQHTINQLPETMKQLVWDFGALSRKIYSEIWSIAIRNSMIERAVALSLAVVISSDSSSAYALRRKYVHFVLAELLAP